LPDAFGLKKVGLVPGGPAVPADSVPPSHPAPPAAALRGVLPGCDLAVAAGGTLVLLGPAGAGKTAVLDVLAGFVRPAAGEVWLHGKPADRLPPHRRSLGLVLAQDGPLARRTVAGSIRFALAARGAAGGEDAIGAIMQDFGLAGLGERRAGELSPEQRVRAALARALVGAPGLVLLDEPFAALDPPAREAVLAALKAALAATGAAAVLATRDAGLALAWGGPAVVLEGGAALQSGPVQELYDAPASERVARLLGEANCLPGRVESLEDDTAAVRLGCGPLVEASAAGARPGQPCLVFVRPERIAIAAGTPAGMGPGALAATVTARAWRGGQVRLTLALGEGRPAALIVTRPAGVPLAGLEPGQAAAIAWQPRHARVLPPAA
jgi:ABC-type Fe3+/spermidine/putrescine transport system ATPase subunit